MIFVNVFSFFYIKSDIALGRHVAKTIMMMVLGALCPLYLLYSPTKVMVNSYSSE